MVLHFNDAGDCSLTETCLEGIASRGEVSEMKVTEQFSFVRVVALVRSS